MKTYKNLYEKALEIKNIKAAIKKASEKKHKRKDVQEILEHLDKYADKVREMMASHSYEPPQYQFHEIHEGTKNKTRYIEKPRFKYDQIIQHVLITQLKPIITKSLYEYAYGSLEKRGPKQAKDVIHKWVQKDIKNTRYCLQCDIRHFYPSVDQEILIAMYERIIKDEEFNIENNKIIRSCPQGLALGAPTSVWHSHFMMTPLDHRIKELDGAVHYLRFADDMFIFGPNKKKLHKVQQFIADYLDKKLHLKMKNDWQVFRFDWIDRQENHHGRSLNALGYRFYRDRTGQC